MSVTQELVRYIYENSTILCQRSSKKIPPSIVKKLADVFIRLFEDVGYIMQTDAKYAQSEFVNVNVERGNVPYFDEGEFEILKNECSTDYTSLACIGRMIKNLCDAIERAEIQQDHDNFLYALCSMNQALIQTGIPNKDKQLYRCCSYHIANIVFEAIGDPKVEFTMSEQEQNTIKYLNEVGSKITCTDIEVNNTFIIIQNFDRFNENSIPKNTNSKISETKAMEKPKQKAKNKQKAKEKTKEDKKNDDFQKFIKERVGSRENFFTYVSDELDKQSETIKYNVDLVAGCVNALRSMQLSTIMSSICTISLSGIVLTKYSAFSEMLNNKKVKKIKESENSIQTEECLKYYTFRKSGALKYELKNENYFCRSFFPKKDRDYTKGQTKFSLLYKEKIDFKTGQSDIQINKLCN